MEEIKITKIAEKIKQYIAENLPLFKMTDEELEEKIEELVVWETAGEYFSIEEIGRAHV